MATDFECRLDPRLASIDRHERRTFWVVLLTALMMVVEVVAGYWTGSMSLLADGYHMASHAGALGISYLAYRLTRSPTLQARLTFGTGKLLPLGGYTSCICLGLIAAWMAFESTVRMFDPVAIDFSEAIVVAIVGLAVNVASLLILHDPHSHDRAADHNHHSAILHVLADALTSVAAIVALLCGKFFGASWLDPILGLVGSLVILKWAIQLGRSTASELLDAHSGLSRADVARALMKEEMTLVDFHSWKIGPKTRSIQLVVETKTIYPEEFFKKIFSADGASDHLVVEQRILKRSGE